MTSPKRDELYDKYRVFREPEVSHPDGHPVPLIPPRFDWHPDGVTLEEVEGFYFVLRPEKDPHALAALVAYGVSCRDSHPKLSSDLLDIARELL